MELPELKKRVKSTSRAYDELDRELAAYARLGDSASAVFQKEEILEHVGRLAEQLKCDLRNQVESWLEAEEPPLRELALRLGHRLALELEEALSRHGIKLSGQLPQLRAAGLTILVDQKSRKAQLLLGPETARSGVRLNAEDIASAVVSVLAELEGAPFDPQEFLAQLATAYDELLAVGGGGRGINRQVPLPEVFSRIVFMRQSARFRRNPTRDNFTPYQRVQFGYDLFRLRQSEVKRVGGRECRLVVATVDATKHWDRYIWVPDDRFGNGTRYSYLTLESAR